MIPRITFEYAIDLISAIIAVIMLIVFSPLLILIYFLKPNYCNCPYCKMPKNHLEKCPIKTINI